MPTLYPNIEGIAQEAWDMVSGADGEYKGIKLVTTDGTDLRGHGIDSVPTGFLVKRVYKNGRIVDRSAVGFSLKFKENNRENKEKLVALFLGIAQNFSRIDTHFEEGGRFPEPTFTIS